MAKASKSNLGTELGVAALGMAVGGVLGMLFAPQSGKQTRKKIASKGRKAVASVSKTVSLKTAKKKQAK